MNKPSTLEQLVREIIPLLGTTWVDNYEAKQDWIKRAQKELTVILPISDRNPLVCHCETFEGENWECERCGGMKF